MELDKELVAALTQVDHHMYVLALRRLAETIDTPDMVALALAKEHLTDLNNDTHENRCIHCTISQDHSLDDPDWRLSGDEREFVAAYCDLLKRDAPIKGVADPEMIEMIVEWAFAGPLGELADMVTSLYSYRLGMDDYLPMVIEGWEGRFDWDVLWMGGKRFQQLTQSKEENK